jgi:heme exporter protein C
MTINKYISYSRMALPYLCVAFIITITYGLIQALYISPEDYQQGDYARIMYIHVPSAWLALLIYSFIAVMSLINIIYGIKLCYIIARASARIGIVFAAITLITGSIWGKPMWGTWWVWDARLTSMLVLFLFYASYLAINFSGPISKAEKPSSVLAVIGFVNVPIVKFSVDIWNSLHQGSSVIRADGPAIASEMLVPLLIMFIAFGLLFLIVAIMNSISDLAEMRAKS